MLQQRYILIVDSGEEIVCDMYSNMRCLGDTYYWLSDVPAVQSIGTFKMHILIHSIRCSTVLQQFSVALLTIYYDTVSLVPLLFSNVISTLS